MRCSRTSLLVLLFYFALHGPLQAQLPEGSTNEPVEVYVWGQQPISAATEQTRWQKDLELRPVEHTEGVLRLTPGLIIGQHHARDGRNVPAEFTYIYRFRLQK